MTAAISQRHRWATSIGCLVGLAVVLVSLLLWQVPAGSGRLGLDVRVTATLTGELRISPVGPVLSGVNVRPGHDARGRVEVRNQTHRTLDVKVRLKPSTFDLDRAVWMEVRHGDRPLASRTVGDLRRGRGAPVRIAPGQAVSLDLRVFIEEGADRRLWAGRIEDLAIDFQTRLVTQP